MYKNNSSPSGASGAGGSAATFLGRQAEPLFTTATFAQTKFGSTKLKNNSKRTNRYVKKSERERGDGSEKIYVMKNTIHGSVYHLWQ